MLAALQTADERTSFLIRAHIGKHSLFSPAFFRNASAPGGITRLS